MNQPMRAAGVALTLVTKEPGTIFLIPNGCVAFATIATMVT